MSELHELIQKRYSGYAFSNQEVPRGILLQLFEAARWSASCFNEQPWRFIFASKSESQEYERILACLMEANQAWAKTAPVLMITIAHKKFIYNKRPNRHAWHDLGQAMATFSLQATHLGLNLHQMAGFDPEKAKKDLNIPDDFDPVSAVALGYSDSPEKLPEALKKKALGTRQRKTLDELVFQGSWGKPLVAVQ